MSEISISKWQDVSSVSEAMIASQISILAEGRSKVSSKHIYKAFEIIWNRPKTENPVDIAVYFSEIEDENEAGESYKQEWSTAFNPLIVCFFVLAKYEPDGDITPWCAAFMNFCLETAGSNGTSSPGSASFRTYGEETSEPNVGDIVVMQSKVSGEEWRGHVGFYIDHDDLGVIVLGGNQSDGIKKSRYLKDGKRLKLHSFRTI